MFRAYSFQAILKGGVSYASDFINGIETYRTYVGDQLALFGKFGGAIKD